MLSLQNQAIIVGVLLTLSFAPIAFTYTEHPLTKPWQTFTGEQTSTEQTPIHRECANRCKGPQGPRGPIGLRGVPGTRGQTGLTGPPGVRGQPGPKGVRGRRGPEGPEGPQGPTGPQGSPGPKGSPGPPGKQTKGTQGPPGKWGPRGPQGPDGNDGQKGSQGIAGPKGDAGLAGPEGPKGARGKTGLHGIRGPRGIQGQQGLQGPEGNQGPKGAQGFQGPQGIQGPRGVQGQRGVQGAQGIPGLPGPSESLNSIIPFNCSCSCILQKFPLAKSGIYFVNGIKNKPVSVYCDMETDGGGWTVFQRRKDGSTDFYQGWNDYADGFGDVQGEFWLGLENIHKVLNFAELEGQELRIDLKDWKNESAYATYSEFFVSDASSKYTLRIGGYSGTAGNSFELNNRMMFTTKDQDNDRLSYNCAERHHGAWWYSRMHSSGICHHVNLNGKYFDSATENQTGVTWRQWKSWESLKFAEMKFRSYPYHLFNEVPLDSQSASLAELLLKPDCLCSCLLKNDENAKSGIYTVLRSGFRSSIIKVYCDMDTDGGGWTVLQRRRDGSVDFYRKWRDYRTGFGNMESEFWLGLDKLNWMLGLSKTGNRLRIELGDGAENRAYAKYNDFAVGNESARYVLRVSGYNGTAGDSLTFHSGMEFSAKDLDNDGTSRRHNAKAFWGAWWYHGLALSRSNLNGKYSSNGRQGLEWRSWEIVRAKFTEMKFRANQ